MFAKRKIVLCFIWEENLSTTYIHVGTPCNPFPLSMNQTNVQSVIQNSEMFLSFRDISLLFLL